MLKEQIDEIESVITEVSKAMGVPLTLMERMSIARRLAKYHSKELFSVLMALHDKKFFPSGAELEQQVRRALGMDPAKGLSLEQIEKNKIEAIRAGQNPKQAEIGAEVARKSLRLRTVPPAPAVATGPQGTGGTSENTVTVAAKIPLPEPFEEPFDPLAALDDFDEDPLAGLDEF